MYASYVKETIEAAAGRWASFTGADIQTLSQIISSLTEAEVTLVSRISIRSKVWLRTEQLIKYVETNSSSSEPHDEVNSLLINLAQKGVVDILGLDNNISTLCGENLNNAWDILLDVLVSDEWKTIYKLLKLPPDLMNRRKELLVADIKRSFQQQKPLYGTNHTKLLNLLNKVLGPSVYIVRLKPFILQSFRRTQRLSMVCTSSSGNGGMSVYAPVPLNVPLLARFGKLKFPEYKIYSSAPLFPGERAFRQYEASCELFVALELSQIIAKLVSNESATSRANNSSGGNSFINASSFEITKLMKRLLSTITDSVIPFFAPITLHLPCASSNTVMEARILQIGISASEFSIGSMSDHLMKYVNMSIGRHTPCVSINTSSSVYQYCKSISIEASVAIVGTLCFISYIQEIYFNTDLNYSNASSSQSKPRPEFFASLDAGQKLTSLCSLAINEFEKQTCGCYSLATLLIQLLLSAHTQFVRHRRGRWLSRLCIDLEHIHQQYLKSATSDSTDGLYMLQVVDAAKSSVVYMPVTKERTNVFLLLSLIYAQAAMSDSCVRSGEKILFEKRIAKLTSRLFGLSLDEAFNAADLLQLASAGALGLLNCPLFLLQKVVLQISLLVQSVSGTGNIPFKSTDIAHYFAIFVPKPLFDQLELLLPYCKAPPSRPRHTINTPTTHGKAKQADESTFEPISVAKGSISNTTTASTSAYWNCNICTFKNNGNQHTIYCSICHSKRVVIPATNEKTSDVIVIDDGDSVEAIAVDASSSVVILLDSESDDENDEKDEKDNSNVSDNNVISPTDSQSEMFLNTKLFSVFSSHTVSSSSVSTPLAPSSSHIITDEISDSIDDLEEAVDDGDDAAVAPKYLFSDDLVLMGLESIDQALFGPSSQYSPEQQVLVQAMYAMDTYQLEMQNLTICSGVKSSFIPRSFTVFGRRFGNTINAKGKSRFIGPNDTICNVEQYMLGQCYQGDSDSSPVFVDAIRGFGWQGWHCEGACVRSLFALLMWEAVFSDQPDVFQTQYQDSPLDMGYPSFCRSRLPVIYKLLDSIYHASGAELIALVGNRYRAHRGLECRGMSWSYSMHTLQLLAACIGGRVLAHIFRALCVNRKYLGSGFPDLVLVRVRCGIDCIDLSTFLGENWSKVYNTEGVLGLQRGSGGDDLFNMKTPVAKRAKVDIDSPSIKTSENSVPLIDTEGDDDNKLFNDIEESSSNSLASKVQDILPDDLVDVMLPGITSSLLTTNGSSQHTYEAMFVEVKGPNDKLAAHQILWQRILCGSGANVFVGHVKEVELE